MKYTPTNYHRMISRTIWVYLNNSTDIQAIYTEINSIKRKVKKVNGYVVGHNSLQKLTLRIPNEVGEEFFTKLKLMYKFQLYE